MTEDASTKLTDLKSRLRNVTIDEITYYVAEGDLLLDERDLVEYAERRPQPADAEATDAKRLLGILDGGRIVRWKPGMELSYRIVKSSFSDAEYGEVRANLKQATFDWESVCGVKFRHLAELDGAQGGTQALFAVQKVNAGGQLIAAAFFPNDAPSRRQLVIDPSYFSPNLSFDKVGVLRHELGHVLGFRHEHIRSGAPAVCPHESLAGTVELAKYDPKSVMHYFCGDVGSRDLKITELDKAGSQLVYGPPLANFRFVD